MPAVPRAASAWPSDSPVPASGDRVPHQAKHGMSRATFPAAARLHRPEEFAAALSGRRVARGNLLVLTALTHPTGAAHTDARLGLVIGKRHAQRASTRNAIKRVVRESFRSLRMDLPAGDYVMRLQRAVGQVSLTSLKLEVRTEADAHFAKVRR